MEDLDFSHTRFLDCCVKTLRGPFHLMCECVTCTWAVPYEILD